MLKIKNVLKSGINFWTSWVVVMSLCIGNIVFNLGVKWLVIDVFMALYMIVSFIDYNNGK